MDEVSKGQPPGEAKPMLVYFYSESSGRSRRTDGFVAQVLQRRHNHDTFKLVRVSVEERPDLAKKFRVETVPTICVVEDRKLQSRIVSPRGAKDLEKQLKPWLR